MNGWDEFCEIDLESLAAPEILERGRAYFQDGHVLETFRLGPVLAGIVAGTGSNYKPRLWLEDGTVCGECDCPYQGFCKHLAVLALAWLESPANFKNIEPQLQEVLQEPEMIRETFIKLCQYNPIGFYYLSESSLKPGFHSTRGILNLVRNTFGRRQTTHRDCVAFWENFERIRDLLSDKLRCGNAEALHPFGELLKGISAAYLEIPSEILTKAFEKTSVLIMELPAIFNSKDLLFLLDILLEFYFEPKLWEWSEICRGAVCFLGRLDSNYFFVCLEGSGLQERTTLELVSTFELLREPEMDTVLFTNLMRRIEDELGSRQDGRLWLIDRYCDEDPERSFRLVKEGMRLSDAQDKLALRERLVQLHIRRREFKQAAALCFIQFREEPSFEGYLRLKDILRHHEQEWEIYFGRVNTFLRDKTMEEKNTVVLALKIFWDAGEYQKFKAYLVDYPVDAETLFSIIDSLNVDAIWEAADVFPEVVEGLLMINTDASWKKASKLLNRYKKICTGTFHFEEWQDFCRRMNEEFGNERRFHRKFGTILKNGGVGIDLSRNKPKFSELP